MIEPSFNQTQVQPQLGFGFPEGLRALIRPEPDTDALRQQATRDGMRPLRLAGAQRVALGQTVLAEVLAATPAWVHKLGRMV